MNPDEKAVIDRAARGDKDAFGHLVRQYRQKIFGFMMIMTANRDMAADLTQETFLAAWQNLPGFRQEASFSTWLFQIGGNKARNYLKRAGREVSLDDSHEKASQAASPEEAYEHKRQEELLQKVAAALPIKQRMIFSLRYFDGLKFEEIARIQGVTVSAVKTGFAEALMKLKKRLGGR